MPPKRKHTGDKKQSKLKIASAIINIDSTSDESEDESLSPSKKVKVTKNVKSEIVKKEPKVSKVKTECIDVKKLKISIKDETWIKDLLVEKEKIHVSVAHSLVGLFEAGNTIPFIARYRRHLTQDLSPEKLRKIKDTFEELCQLNTKTNNVLKLIEKSGDLTPDLKYSIENCKSLSELNHVYAPFKQGSKKTLAERAKSLGLDNVAQALLTGSETIDRENLIKLVVRNGSEGIRSLEEVESSLTHLIAHYIAWNSDVLIFLRDMKSKLNLKLEAKQSTSKNMNTESLHKFQLYFKFSIPVKYAKPHQVLAINRGESLKILSVKIIIPDYLFNEFKSFCQNKWLNDTRTNILRLKLFGEAVADAYKRLIEPLIRRQTRAELTKNAEQASIEVFAANLKKLLLGSPMKGKTILGIDPGIKLGCKIAVISPLGEVLDSGVIYPCARSSEKDVQLVKGMILEHKCGLIALGNGKGCRETETWLTDLIQKKTFAPVDVSYTIVDESGASVYSCSPEALIEFPDLDNLIVSAISLARRIQDPLAELVKMDPKSLGVGMYQHDLNKKTLENTLNEVISECVSFVGVDLNTASLTLLKRVAGLTLARAETIIKHRSKNGPFTNRIQLMDIKGIGEKVFEQCAGFLRVTPYSAKDAKEFFQKPETTPLDSTWIHPESYDLAEKILNKYDLHYKNIGTSDFIRKLNDNIFKMNVKNLAIEFDATDSTIGLIIDVLRKPLAYDLREENRQEPLFRKGITSLSDLTTNMKLTGRITNVTHFGAFVDIGVGSNGLIHNTAMRGLNVELGQRVEVLVQNIDQAKNRISLGLVQIL